MKLYTHSDTHGAIPVTEIGGKASSLLALCQLKMPVPPFVIIPASVFSEMLPKGEEPNYLEIIAHLSIPNELLSNIKREVFTTPETLVAVRSSGIDEDGGTFSFAGQFITELFVSEATLEEAIKKVWASAFDERVVNYRKHNNINANGGIAIIVQRMVNATAAGVAFGMNPVSGQRDEFIISSVYGLGEGLVSGELDSDNFVMSNRGDLISSSIAQKTSEACMKPNGGIMMRPVAESKQNEPSLKSEQLKEVYHVIKSLREQLKYYPDIEFAYESNQLFLLQVRPITTLKNLPDPKGKKIVWDNSNIIESYPGLTSPLTFSFIVKMYEAVYRQLSLVMGIDEKKVEQHASIYSNMLGLLKGRVYYNLNSWYGALQLLPGYSLNAAFMEKMMGVKESFDSGLIIERKGWRDYFDIFKAIRKILYNQRTSNQQRIEFQSYFNQVMKHYESMDFSELSANELMEVYLEFEQTLVKKWKAPLVNDFFAMIYFGVLQKQCASLFPEAPVMHNDLVSGANDIISTEPITLSLNIVSAIEKDPKCKRIFEEKSPLEIWDLMKSGEMNEIYAMVKNYIYRWGDRSVGELKLETLTYHQHPEWYIAIVKSYLQQGITNHTKSKNNLRAEAENKLEEKLKGKPLKKIIFKYVLRKARYFVSNRENLRYERTRGFGMVRNMFLALGNRLFAEQVLIHPRDIFWLSQEELFDFINGTSIHLNLMQLVQLRKKEYEEYEKETPNERITTRGMVYSGNSFLQDFSMPTLEVQSTLHGIACCAGIVKAKIRVVHHPSEISGLDGDILVTSSTDPGWVTLFPTCSGILVERGSLLSHSAIVSREMGIPCIVGIKGLLQQVKTGDWVLMNGITGSIQILNGEVE